MSKKRLIASFSAVVVLLAVAGAIELALLAFPASDNSDTTLQSEESAAAARSAAESEQSGETEAADPPVAEDGARKRIMVPTKEEVRAAELVKSGAIVYNGSPLMRGAAEAIVESAAPFTSSVEHIDQRTVLPSGCEIVSLAVALKAEGFDASPVEIADGHLRVGNDFTVDYIGSPRSNGGGFPACVVDAGNSWLASRNASARAVNLTGTTFGGIEELVELGYPVLAWTTEQMVDPVPSGNQKDGLQWYRFEHCVVVCGIEDGEVLVADPLAGLVHRERAAFARIYGECGNLAVFVQP